MAIDWSKPLELTDGTPVRIATGPNAGWNGMNPDMDGHYWLVRLDGKEFFPGNCSRELCVSPSGDHGEYGLRVRNRTEWEG